MEHHADFRFTPATLEVWVLHSGTLGKDLGLYEHLTDQFSQLSIEGIRCCRWVVDTGVRALGRPVRFVLDDTAMGEHDARTEVIRYITWPVQACTYKVGEGFIRKMRTNAEERLKDQFDPRDFFDVLLLSVAVSLDLLKERVEMYVGNISNDQISTSNQDVTKEEAAVDIIEAMTLPAGANVASSLELVFSDPPVE